MGITADRWYLKTWVWVSSSGDVYGKWKEKDNCLGTPAFINPGEEDEFVKEMGNRAGGVRVGWGSSYSSNNSA